MASKGKEPSTGIEFPGKISPAGGSAELSLVGVGVRERKIAFIKVKIYALGFYIDAAGISSLASWKSKSGSVLEKDEAFFKALVDAPVEKAVRIVLARDVEDKFWGALEEALTPRLKKAGPAGQQAIASLGSVFKDRSLKDGTTIVFTWVQPSTLKVSITPSGSAAASAPEATIESAVLLPALFDVYLGKDPASPPARTAIANNFSSL